MLPNTLCMCILQVQVRPWFIADSEYKHHPGQGPDPRKTVFIGGVPRPMRACELADIMNERFGHVSYAAIDLDTDVNYPKGEDLMDSQLTWLGSRKVMCLLLVPACQVLEGSLSRQPTASLVLSPHDSSK